MTGLQTKNYWAVCSFNLEKRGNCKSAYAALLLLGSAQRRAGAGRYRPLDASDLRAEQRSSNNEPDPCAAAAASLYIDSGDVMPLHP